MSPSPVAVSHLLILSSIALSATAAPVSSSNLERKFAQDIKPILAKYCVGCHSGVSPAGQFDMPFFPRHTA